MPRQIRIQYADAVYHVIARGNRRGKIFVDDEDREIFLRTVEEMCSRAGFEVFAWVLMGNHYHLVLRTPNANLVEGMSWLQNTYTRRFNARHKLWGRLFGDRYRSILVENDDSLSSSSRTTGPGYLPTLIDYIHLNPARAKIIRARSRQSIADFPWSSLADGYLLSPSKRPAWLIVEEGLESFGLNDTSRDRRRYLENLDAQIASEQASSCGVVEIEGQSLDSTLRRGWYWGSEDFREKMLKKLKKTADRPQNRNYRSSSQGSDARIAEANRILSAGARHFGIRPTTELPKLPRGDRRRVAISWALWKTTSMPQAWIASKTGYRTAANVSQQVRRFDALGDQTLSRLEHTWKARFATAE